MRIAKKLKFAFPKSVPVLLPANICRNRIDDNHGRHCLWGWVLASGFIGAAKSQARDEIQLSGKQVGAADATRCIETMNDNEDNPRKLLAEIWNKAMVQLGYRRRAGKFV